MLAVPMPGLLFLGYGTHYYVWAYKLWKCGNENSSKHRLRTCTMMARSVSETSIHGSPTGNTITNSWRLFWDSNFSDHLANGKSNAHPDNILPFLAKLHSN